MRCEMKTLLIILILQILLYSNTAGNNIKNMSLFERALYKGEIIREYLHKRLTSYATNIDNF